MPRVAPATSRTASATSVMIWTASGRNLLRTLPAAIPTCSKQGHHHLSSSAACKSHKLRANDWGKAEVFHRTRWHQLSLVRPWLPCVALTGSCATPSFGGSRTASGPLGSPGPGASRICVWWKEWHYLATVTAESSLEALAGIGSHTGGRYIAPVFKTSWASQAGLPTPHPGQMARPPPMPW